MKSSSYIPPLRFQVLTPAYDWLVRWTSAEAHYRRTMIQALSSRRFSLLVDLGCGTGTLVLALAKAFPHARLAAIDADTTALAIAATKLRASSASAALLHGDARSLPFPDGTIDAFTSSLFFHHLDDSGKWLVLREVRRCLTPGGTFVVADWDRADSFLRRVMFNSVRGLDGFDVTQVHARGEFGEVLESAGFETVNKSPVPAMLGQISVWTCTKRIDIKP